MSADGKSHRIVLVTGGVRSGKSRYAQDLAMRGRQVAFIATAEGRDDDMKRRIARHQEERPANWKTVEAPVALPEAIARCGTEFDTILVDCLTMWTSNLLESEGGSGEKILAQADRLVEVVRKAEATVIFVTNEVGGGIVPDNDMARFYRDMLGFINQRMAAVADEVVLLVAGCPLFAKRVSSGFVDDAERAVPLG
jgi:adenosylcobinamide kinase / adenosylcobinamide-phosphate guanylyltransferase